MKRQKYAGIDYGLGRTNRDLKTGIRYGVIAANSLASWIFDEMEAVYIARCPECYSELGEQWCDGDHCPTCSEETIEPIALTTDDVYGDEAEGWILEPSDKRIKVEIGDLGGAMLIWVIESPFVTHASYCSPCVPGGGDLDSPNSAGPLTYCLPAEWFEDRNIPYPLMDLSRYLHYEQRKEQRRTDKRRQRRITKRKNRVRG
jgi:hypothetical protein